MSRPASASGGSRWWMRRAVLPWPRCSTRIAAGSTSRVTRTSPAGAVAMATVVGRSASNSRSAPGSTSTTGAGGPSKTSSRLPTCTKTRSPARTRHDPSSTTRPTSRSSPGRSTTWPAASRCVANPMYDQPASPGSRRMVAPSRPGGPGRRRRSLVIAGSASDPEPAQVLAVASLRGHDRGARVGLTQGLVLLDDQPAPVVDRPQCLDHFGDARIALAQLREDPPRQRRLETLALALHVVHHRALAVLDVHMADEVPVVVDRLHRVRTPEAEVAGVEAESEERGIQPVHHPGDLVGRLDVRASVGMDHDLEALRPADLGRAVEVGHERLEAIGGQPGLGMLGDAT